MEKKRLLTNKFKHGFMQKLSKNHPNTAEYIKIKSLKSGNVENVFKVKNPKDSVIYYKISYILQKKVDKDQSDD